MHRPARLALLVPVLAVAATLAAGSSAATRSTAAAASFCSASKGVAKQLISTAQALKSSATLAQRQAELKAQFTTIKNAEGALRSSVPHSLKRKLGTVLSYADLVNAKLSAVNWSFPALAQNTKAVSTLEAAAARANGAIGALRTYYRKTCRFPV